MTNNDMYSPTKHSKYMLITVCDREISTEVYDSFEEAHAQMMRELSEYGKVDLENDGEDEEEFCYGDWGAYANNGVNHSQYDWSIVEI